MMITNKITVSTSNGAQNAQGNEKVQERREQKNKGIFAGNGNLNTFENNLLQKKKAAQEKAMKVIGDAFNADKKIDEDLQARRDKIASLRQDNHDAREQLKELTRQQETLQKEYGVSADSQEQKDLELLRKKKDMLSGKGEGLTEEEWKRVAELQGEGLTEYQQRQLELDDQKKYYEDRIKENEQEILVENAVIRGTAQERLKYAPMADAKKQAEDIRKAAGQEVIHMVLEEGKEHIDEEQEKREEQAKIQEERRKEQEEFIEAQKEKREEGEAIIEDMPMEEMLSLSKTRTDVQKEVQNIIDKMKLVAEDMKGSVVDQNL